jgi:hypothetical protein
LKNAFQRIDSLLSSWGVRLSKVFLPHFGEVGKNVLPYLKERGIVFFALPLPIGVPFNYTIGGPRKGLLPFGGQGGTLDIHPEDPDLFVAESDYTTLPKAELDVKVEKGEVKVPYQMYDFLWDWGRDEVDIEKAARHAANQLKLGLDNLIFGQINTHEQNIAMLSSAEWDALLTRLEELTIRYKKIWRKWEDISSYAANRYRVKLSNAEYDPPKNRITCNFEGFSEQSLYIYIFYGESDCPDYNLYPVPSFKNSLRLEFEKPLVF